MSQVDWTQSLQLDNGAAVLLTHRMRGRSDIWLVIYDDGDMERMGYFHDDGKAYRPSPQKPGRIPT